MILQAIKISNQFYLNNFLSIFQTCILSVILVSALSANSPYLSSSSSIVSVIVSTFLQVHLTCMLMMVTADIINNSQQSVINYYFKSVFYIVPLLSCRSDSWICPNTWICSFHTPWYIFIG